MTLSTEAAAKLTTTLSLVRANMSNRALPSAKIASSVGISVPYLEWCLAGKRRLAPSRLAVLCREVGIDFISVAATLDSLVGGTAYLRLTRAARSYECSYCQSSIRQYEPYVRLEPFGPTRQAGADVLHFCKSCSIIGGWIPPTEWGGGRVTDEDQLQLPFSRHVKPTQVRLIDISETVWTGILTNPDELFQLNPAQFEEFVFERLCAMGLCAHRVGKTNRKDGGIDSIFTPPKTFPFPFLGAVQAKHHRDPRLKVGPAPLRELQGVLSASRIFSAGMIVTNTTFTPDARDFAARNPTDLRLRDFSDLKRWIANNFTDDAEWREIPDHIELCRGISVDLRL